MFSSAAPEFSAQGSTGPLSDLRYMFRQTKEWRQAAEPAYAQGGAGSTQGPWAASAETCTHPAKRDRCFPPPIAER